MQATDVVRKSKRHEAATDSAEMYSHGRRCTFECSKRTIFFWAALKMRTDADLAISAESSDGISSRVVIGEGWISDI